MPVSKPFVAGSMSTLALAAIGATAFAQSSTSSSSTAVTDTPDPAACSAALDTATVTQIAHMDAMYNAQESALKTRTAALKAALALTDATARDEAITAANTAFHESMKTAMSAIHDEDHQAQMEAFKKACEGLKVFGPMGGMMKGGHKGFMRKGGHGMRGGMPMDREFDRTGEAPDNDSSSSEQQS